MTCTRKFPQLREFQSMAAARARRRSVLILTSQPLRLNTERAEPFAGRASGRNSRHDWLCPALLSGSDAKARTCNQVLGACGLRKACSRFISPNWRERPSAADRMFKRRSAAAHRSISALRQKSSIAPGVSTIKKALAKTL